jgi:hypothetical protein
MIFDRLVRHLLVTVATGARRDELDVVTFLRKVAFVFCDMVREGEDGVVHFDSGVLQRHVGHLC